MFKHKNNCYIRPSAKCNSYLNNILHKMCISFTEAKKHFYLELTVLSSFFNRNSNARIYRIRWHFCCLYVSYSSIFMPIQHFSRLI